jgi:hypothetical protein
MKAYMLRHLWKEKEEEERQRANLLDVFVYALGLIGDSFMPHLVDLRLVDALLLKDRELNTRDNFKV